ncbi:unnamed protein product [Parnassius apollo]|uniref:(apollo) hypothetical protein n=1 Tax=Parnassius apollo TaxID=110799 RepID=A0A8S3WPK2_PARAO|nr:unnamed protein product [Parnassius apollo]
MAFSLKKTAVTVLTVFAIKRCLVVAVCPVAIPRANWEPSKGSFVCSEHFSDSEVIRCEKVLNPNGSYEVVPLKNPKLVTGAVPHIFPNLPKYLSTKKTSRMDPSKRRQMCEQRREEIDRQTQEKDIIKDFFELKSKVSQDDAIYSGWNLKIFEEKMFFYTLNIDFNNKDSQNVRVLNSICIDSDLSVKLFIGETQLPPNDLKWTLTNSLTLFKWSQLKNLLDRYKDSPFTCTESMFEFNIKKAEEQLETALQFSDEQECKQLDLIKDQLKLCTLKQPRYSVSTVIFAFLIFCISQSCYNLIRRFLFLPHKRYLQYLSSSFNVNPSNLENTNNYLKVMYNKLDSRERVVNLCIDEIYVNSKLEYKCKKVTGYADNDSNELAKTVVCFMVSSTFGRFKEIVRIIPVNSLTGHQLKDYTLEVINFIQLIGFQILCIITDNNRVNQNMYKLIAGDSIQFLNPNYPSKSIYVMYDPVHIFKNIRNNWLNLRSPGKTFMFHDFETGQIKMACFNDIEKLYKDEGERCIKKAYKLNSKTLYPSKLERQNVSLVDNLFHNSTISALKSKTESQSTGQFLEIIRMWWNIVNVKNKIKGLLKRDTSSSFISAPDDENIVHLAKFIEWLDKWLLLNGGSFLSKDTFTALRHSTVALIEVVKTSFRDFNIKYILLGKFQSDCIEKRFGQYRFLSGCNYNVSCTQIIEAEKKIRLRHLMKLEDIGKELKNYKEVTDSSTELLTVPKEFKSILSSNYLEAEICDIDEPSQIYRNNKTYKV